MSCLKTIDLEIILALPHKYHYWELLHAKQLITFAKMIHTGLNRRGPSYSTEL